MANFTTKTIKEVYDTFISKYTIMRNKYGDTSPLLEKSFVKSLGYAIAGIAGNLWQLAVWVYKQCFPQTCDLPVLKFWGGLIGVDYNSGQTANVVIKLTDVTAISLNSRTVYKDLTSGLIFRTVSESITADGIIYATAECSKSGTVGNIPVGTTLNIANPLDGIPATAIVDSFSIEGTEDEEVETYRKRVLYKFRNKSQSGSFLDYYNWAMDVPGIVDVLPYVLEEGIITIYPVADGSGKDRTPSGNLTPNPFPYWENGQFTPLTGNGQFLQIANSIEGNEEDVHNRRPVMATVELKAPNYTGFTVEIDGLTKETYNDLIKDVLISVFDKKRPQIIALGYPETNAKINKLQLSSSCTEVIESESFTSFLLKDSEGVAIDEATLGIGCLAYLSELKINNHVVYSADGDEPAEDEQTGEALNNE